MIRVFFGITLCAMVMSGCTQKDEQDGRPQTEDLTRYVNPFIGTGGHGHTFPGATLPFGMVQLSPDTRAESCGGYHYSDSTILGFSHTHLSGTDMADYSDILLMPFTGEGKVHPGTVAHPDSGYRSRFTHDEETASPGYYAVMLSDEHVKVELTATLRAGFHRYQFPKDSAKGVVIDLAHAPKGYSNRLNELRVISDTEIAGLKVTRGWAGENRVYFHAKFNKPFEAELYSHRERADATVINSTSGQAILTFDPDETTILAKVGISSVDYEGAKANLFQEIPDWDFDGVHAAAAKAWNTRLNTITVQGGSRDQQTVFYTALYHASISPSLFSDVDGRYRGMDHRIHAAGGGSPEYTVFPLWDTFRAFHPLLTIIDPERNEAFIRSLLTKYRQGGVLPRWELGVNYTGAMIGDHAISVIYDAYKKGSRNFDAGLAYQAMKEATAYDTAGILAPDRAVLARLKPMAKYYNETLGFIPADLENESVSKALEFAYNDWCVAQMAKDLGKNEDYEVYMARSQRYQEYFDKSTGLMRGKNRDGHWREPFPPRCAQYWKADYIQGNAWQWTWFVPHDVAGLIQLMGGVGGFRTRLDSFFSTPSKVPGEDISGEFSGRIGQYAHENEPAHHVAHLYNFIGESWKTQQLTDTIMNALYTNAPDGLSGSEDFGQMSAWYIMNAMGFYPVCPGNPEYSLGRPLFDEVTLNLQNGNQFTIRAVNNSRTNKYIQNATLNAADLDRPFFSHQDILDGGVLELEMGPSPNRSWGVVHVKNLEPVAAISLADSSQTNR